MEIQYDLGSDIVRSLMSVRRILLTGIMQNAPWDVSALGEA